MTIISRGPRVAMLSVHTSPLDQPGIGDAGGMNVYIMGLAAALARQGAQVEIFTRATASHLPDVVEVAPGIIVRHVVAGPFEGLDKNDLPGQLCAFTAGVLHTEAARNVGWYDVVHSHYWLSGQSGWLAADRWDVPLVHTMHTMAKVKNAALPAGDTPEPLGRIIGEEQVVEAADALVASTGTEATELIEMYDADPGRVHVVAPGVDLDLFHPMAAENAEQERASERERLGLPATGPIILFAGRIQPLKGPDVLVEAAAQMREAGNEVPTFVFLGGPSGRMTALRELQALAAQLGVSDRVQFRPPVERAELANWFRAADLVAVPSYNESFGLVAAEAQACGTPVIAAAVGGLQTVVDDGVGGVLVSGHDPQVWAQTFAGVLQDQERMGELRAGAQQTGAEFGWDATALAMLEVYQRARTARTQRTEELRAVHGSEVL